MNYDFWKKSLAGEKPKMYVDDPQPGFYRRAIYTKEPNKAAKRTGWTPVAIFNIQPSSALLSILASVTGSGRDAKMETDRDKLNELWSYIAANPISEATYRAVAERGEPWPDSHETVASIPVANSSSSIESLETEELDSSAHMIGLEVEELAKEHMDRFILIESDEHASKARSLQLKFLELKKEAVDGYEAVNRPLLDKQKILRETWFPVRDAADGYAKTLSRAMGKWEDDKRKAAKIAAERAEAGQDNAVSNVPPPSTQIRGGAGRAASVTVEKVVTVINVDKVFEQFKTAPQVIELLTVLAQKAIRSGIDVPGATYEERSVVR